MSGTKRLADRPEAGERSRASVEGALKKDASKSGGEAQQKRVARALYRDGLESIDLIPYGIDGLVMDWMERIYPTGARGTPSVHPGRRIVQPSRVGEAAYQSGTVGVRSDTNE